MKPLALKTEFDNMILVIFLVFMMTMVLLGLIFTRFASVRAADNLQPSTIEVEIDDDFSPELITA
ncbi:hypothetical protein A3C59_02135 [Candidatus Daviesbacteria bacterium RIFCSPHIGHO2_02_FULL_36_13]|uniref:Uncharacterized protein n=1 Tax=Candidatus Daviesbacteria bacterium RIFCSPHIGHO2_02_FULL_36_13 TaxID=1797768 RepID=A0A1F5JVJ4_9BACT|nr:MAG: hypothetical protein A3C59_02135 [Candidatus Daviesbacteria bacterium RIFCSPHIGHO2_02_FULL_36_13]OGE44710.1 MAG: hypothetical protein A3A45_00870 [Candidatus Daviesbacteria bacterium RIFCSPLOWO2_01_FULL_36_8]